MFKAARPLTIVVETPLHAGSGSELGVVDLPIQRERHTNHPKIEASTLKGCLREAFEGQQAQHFPDLNNQYKRLYIYPVFGPEYDQEEESGEQSQKREEYASALGVTDARLLLFPVKSIRGVFAWITCPAIINRLLQDLALTKKLGCEIPAPEIGVDVTALKNSIATGNNLFVKGNQIILEEFTYSVDVNESCTALAQWIAKHVLPQDGSFSYWRNKIEQDLVVLNDDDFRDFATMSTEVITRTKISDDTGTVQHGALWDEEYLPADSVLYALVLTSDPFDTLKKEERLLTDAAKIMDFFTQGLERAQHIFQLGGNATIGKGLVRVAMMG